MEKYLKKINNNLFIETISNGNGRGGSSALYSYNTFIFSINSEKNIVVSKKHFCYSKTTSNHVTKSGLLLPEVQDIIKKAVKNNLPKKNTFEYQGYFINFIN
jgi:hypothetical protein